MGKIIYSSGIGFNMSDWEKENITRVFAGNDCVMAITADGRVLQKVADTNIEARTEYWRNITEIAISNFLTGAAIGIVSDGTCMISKRPVRNFCEKNNFNFDRINSTVKSWNNIIEVAASDAFFALDSFGRVHYVTLNSAYDDYTEVTTWKNVRHIFCGTQNSVFAITADGSVLCAGANCTNGPLGNMRNSFEGIKDARYICACGSECSQIILIREDGTVTILPDVKYNINCCTEPKPVACNMLTTLIRDTNGILHEIPYGSLNISDLIPNIPISDFAVGDRNYITPFYIAVTK